MGDNTDNNDGRINYPISKKELRHMKAQQRLRRQQNKAATSKV
jgi:hypothetical protein